jgi:type II secretory pathway pseudopilin PulG
VKKYYTGFTLIELLFVLLIAVIIILMGVNHYRKYAAEKDVTQISYNVSLIFQVANEYFRANYDAKKTPPFTASVSRQDIIKANLWPKLLLVGNKLVSSDNNYEVTVTPLQIKNVYTYSFTVTVAFPGVANTDVLAWYKNILNANGSDFSKKQLSWMRKPSYSTDKIDTHLWPMTNQLQQFTNFMSGRYQE